MLFLNKSSNGSKFSDLPSNTGSDAMSAFGMGVSETVDRSPVVERTVILMSKVVHWAAGFVDVVIAFFSQICGVIEDSCHHVTAIHRSDFGINRSSFVFNRC